MSSLEQENAVRHEYQLTTFHKSAHLVFAVGLIVAAGSFFHLAENPIGRDFALIVGISLLISGFTLALSTFRSRLIIDGNRIEVRSALHTASADRNEIEGLRQMKNQYGSWTRIYLRENRGAFNVSGSFAGKDELDHWLKGLPDLDQRDAVEITQQIDNDDSQVGAMGTKRPNPLQKAKAWMICLSVTAGLFSIPAMFVSYAPVRTILIVVLAFLPPLALLLVHLHPLWFTFFKRKADPRADLTIVITLPAIGLLMSLKAGHANLIDIFQLGYWALLVLACYLAASFRSAWENPSRWGALFGVVVFGAMYGVGVVNASNTLLDRSAPETYQTYVVKTYETHGKGAGFYLRLAPWGSLKYFQDAEISARVYRRTRIGDQICLEMHRGFLHAPWFTLVPCLAPLNMPTPLNE